MALTVRGVSSKDVVAGLAAGAVVVPQAMAYATVAGLPVQVGLYTCIVPTLVYAVLGGSRTMSVSTTSTVAVLTGSTLAAAGVARGSDDPARDLATLTVLVGLLLLGVRALRLGGVIDNISEATLTGVRVGVGLSVAAAQLPDLMGVPSDGSSGFFPTTWSVLRRLGDAEPVTVALSGLTLAVLLGASRLTRRVPGPLLAVALGIVIVLLTDAEDRGLERVAPVPPGLPEPVLPSLEHVGGLLPGAFAIAMMVFLETVAVARSVRRAGDPSIDNDRELGAIGLSCLLGGLFRALPAAGGFSQTAVNQRAGARSQFSELVTVALAVACALFLGGLLSELPRATLACMVVVAVSGLVRPADFVRLWRVSRVEFWLAATTAACGLVVGLLTAVLVGVLLTLVLVLRELDRAGLTELQPVSDDLQPVGERTLPVPGLLVLRFDAPLYTANIRSMNRKLVAAVDATDPPPRVLVVDMTAVGALSTTVLGETAELARQLEERGVEFHVAGLTERALRLARTLPRWDSLVEAGRVHATALAAVRAQRSTAQEPSTTPTPTSAVGGRDDPPPRGTGFEGAGDGSETGQLTEGR